MKACNDAESMEECCLPLDLLSLIPYGTHGSLPRDSTAYHDLGTTSSIINQ